MRIALDIDGVVGDTSTMMQEEAERRGYNMDFDQYTPSVEGVDDVSKFINDIVDGILTNRIFEIEPYSDAIWFIPLISIDLGPITFITARKEEFHSNTLVWLRHHFPISFSFVGRSSSEKAEFLIENNYDVFVEDRLRTANSAAELGLKTYLIDRPWNIGRETHKDVIRVEGLNQFYTLEMELVRYGE